MESHPIELSYSRVSKASRWRSFLKFAKWFVIIFGAMLGIAALAHTVWLGWTTWQLNRVQAEIRQAGEPVESADLIPKAVPVTSNGFPLLIQAVAQIPTSTDAARRREQIDYGSLVTVPLFPLERKRLSAHLNESAAAIRLIEAAIAMPTIISDTPPMQFGPAQYLSLRGSSTRLPASDVRICGQLLIDRALLAADAGRHDDAIDDLLRMSTLAAAAATCPESPGQQIAAAMHYVQATHAIALARSLQIGAQAGQARPAAIAALIAQLLDDRTLIETFKRQVRINRVEHVAWRRTLQTAGPWSRGHPSMTWFQRHLTKPLHRSSATEILLTGRTLLACLNEKDYPSAKARLRSQPSRSAALSWGASLGSRATPTVIEAAFQLATYRSLAATRLATRWYEIEHGRLPGTLADLVPKYLPHLPTDFMQTGGGHLHADFTGSTARIWSVGNDGVDQGGTLSTSSSAWESIDRVVPLAPMPRHPEGLVKMLIDLDFDGPILPAATTPTPLPQPPPIDPSQEIPMFPSWEDALAFEVHGDPTAFGFTERREAFIAVADSFAQVVPKPPSTQPTGRLWGSVRFNSGVWRFELRSDGTGTFVMPDGRLVPVTHVPGRQYDSGGQPWR